MTYPPDPYQPSQPYGQGDDPTTQYSPNPYAAPASGQPTGYGSSDYGADAGGYGEGGSGVGAGGYSPGDYGASSGAGGYGPGTGGYGANPYGGPQPYPAYGPQARTNALAVASLACSLGGLITCVSAPVGIVFGHIARRQIRETGEQGEGMAIAGLWVGYILTVVGLLLLAGWLFLFVFLVRIGHAGG